MIRTNERLDRRAGMTILEMSTAAGIFSVVILGSLAMVRKDNDLAYTSLGISVAEMKAQQMIRRLESELGQARGIRPTATATANLSSSATDELEVGSTRGFPPFGILLVERGTAVEERLTYGGLSVDGLGFEILTRGQQCTDPAGHAGGTQVRWAGLAEPIALQNNPPAAQWDGVAVLPTGNTFFRGDGSGFAYQVPTDPAGGNDFLDADGLRWGAEVAGNPTLDGFHAVIFAANFQYAEADTNDDINGDGDRTDVFDIGQLRRLTWDASDPAGTVQDIGIGPNVILQERCNWGGDLDGDGFDDPLFLWNEGTRRLHIRLFVLGRSRADVPIVRRVEAAVFLRNEVSS